MVQECFSRVTFSCAQNDMRSVNVKTLTSRGERFLYFRSVASEGTMRILFLAGLAGGASK
jgi:hypothetical protein